MIAAGIDAFGAAFAFGRIDEDAELAATAALLLKNGEVLGRDSPLVGHQLALRFIADLAQLLIEDGRLNNLAEDRGIRALSHALHAADAVLGDEHRNIGRDVTEIAKAPVPPGMTLRAS